MGRGLKGIEQLISVFNESPPTVTHIIKTVLCLVVPFQGNSRNTGHFHKNPFIKYKYVPNKMLSINKSVSRV